jgi:hypothetical protein
LLQRQKVPATRCDPGLQSGVRDGGHDRLLAKAGQILSRKEWRQGWRSAPGGSAVETSEERCLQEDPSGMEDVAIYGQMMAGSGPGRRR